MNIRLILIILGGAFAYYGWQEFTLARHAKAEPTEVSAADLEGGKLPENCHVVVKDAVALYPLSVYHYKKSKHNSAAPDANTRTTDVLYPAVSLDHPFTKALQSGTADDQAIKAALSTVGILVRTNRFSTVGSIPGEIGDAKSLQGLVLNKIEKLNAKDAELLRNSFPSLDASKVVILAEDRKPKALALGLGTLVAGVLAVLGVIFSWVKKAAT